MLRYGKISELGTGNKLGFARVSFDELEIVSGWLSLPTSGTKDRIDFFQIPVNTQVAVLMHPDNEQGEIIKAVWSSVDSPPSWANANTEGVQFSDGSTVVFDKSTKELTIKCTKVVIDGELQVSGEVTAGATKIKLTTHTHTSPVGPTGSPIPTPV